MKKNVIHAIVSMRIVNLKLSKEINLRRLFAPVIAGAALLGALGVPSAKAQNFTSQFESSGADNYVVLYEGTGGHHLNINNGPGLSGFATGGNIGIGGTGALQLSGPLTMNGNVNFSAAGPGVNDNGSGTQVFGGGYTGNITVNGNFTAGVSAVSTALSTVNSLSSSLGAESGTALTVNLGNGQSQTVHASSGMLDASGNRVFDLNLTQFGNGATLTIDGDAAGDSVVFNINAGAQFGGTINLSGIFSDQVLFNVIGGNTLQINSNGATEQGTFVDPLGQISEVHSVVDGRIFGGDSSDMSIVSGAELNTPTTPNVNVPDGGSAMLFLSLAFGTLLAINRVANRRASVVARS